MYRGTTPTFEFKLPVDVETITALAVTFRQPGGMPIEKTLDDCELSKDTVSVTLSEQETLSLKANGFALEIQIRCAIGDARLASQIWQVSVGRILKDGAL